MDKPSYEELARRVRELENEALTRRRIEAERSDEQPTLRDQNIRLVKKSIELSDMRRVIEDKNYELELTRAELRSENVDLIRKSIELSDIMRELEDRNYDLELSQSELERALGALRESEEKFRTLTANIKVGIYRTTPGPKGRFVEANPAILEMFGYDNRDDFLAVDVCDLYDNPDDRNGLNEKMLRHGFIKNEELRLRKKDGTVFLGSSSAVAVWDEEGKPGYYDGIIEDITDRKRAEHALRESEEKYRTLVEQSVQGIAVICASPIQILFVNPAGAEIIGFSIEELITLSPEKIEGLIHPEDRKAISQRYRDRMEGKPVSVLYEVRAIHRDGSVCWLEAFPTRIEYQGKPALQVAFVDITDRKRAEEALRQSEERFRELAELLPEIVCEIDDKGILTFVNRQGFENTGYIQEDFDRGFTAVDLLVSEHRERARQSINSILHGEQVGHYEYTAQRKDGSTFPVMVRSTPIMSEGRAVGLRSIMIDMSERKRLEEQLSHAAKMEAIGQLAGGIAHDFNNLLTGILGYANMIKLNADPGTLTHDASKTIEGAAERAGELTNQLLGFARRGKHQIISVDLHKTIYDVVALLSRTINKNIRISVELGAVTGTTLGDPGQLQQMLLNLAINARDAMPEGGDLTFKIRETRLSEDYCRSHVDSAPGEYVAVEVTDTGCGIPSEIQERIYEPFFTTKVEGQGTGMGLATAYGIIKNHGGEIEVSSHIGSGTTFTVYLPLSRTEAGEPTREEGGDSPIVGSGHVLVIDDEEIVRTVVVSMLTELGYRVTVFSNGRDAVEHYREHARDIDLVIVDLVMPYLDGRECFRQLKAIDPNVKAVLSTGYGMDGKVQEILDEGILGFVQKPYQMIELGRKMREILGN